MMAWLGKIGFVWFGKLSKNYNIELQLLSRTREFTDGITFFNFNMNCDLYVGDHKPSFEIELTVFNVYNAFSIFNINHTHEHEIPVSQA